MNSVAASVASAYSEEAGSSVTGKGSQGDLNDEGHSDATPLPSKDFTGGEIAAVVTPDSLPSPGRRATSYDEDGYSDAFSDVSTEEFGTAEGECALYTSSRTWGETNLCVRGLN